MRVALVLALALASSPALAQDILTPAQVQSVSGYQMRDPKGSPAAKRHDLIQSANALAAQLNTINAGLAADAAAKAEQDRARKAYVDGLLARYANQR